MGKKDSEDLVPKVDLNADGSESAGNFDSLAMPGEFGIAVSKIFGGVIFYYNPVTKISRRRFVDSWYEDRDIPIDDIMRDWYENAGHSLQ